jgi:hypothetical protein
MTLPCPATLSAAAKDATLVMVRVLMRQCRAKARMEVFSACALLHRNPSQQAQAYADALLRTLAQVVPSGFVVHAPQAIERSFDEDWLLALMGAIARDDTASTTFLLRARLPRHVRRNVGWLAAQMQARLQLEIPE